MLLIVLALASYMVMSGPNWTKVSTSFMRADKPYGSGDFRIHGDHVISMKLTEPETTFKPREERSLPDVAEPTEAWMYSAKEILIRSTVRVLTGNINSPQRVFEEYAQKADWWMAPDWNTIYLYTGWMNRHNVKPGVRYAPQITKLFKSTNQGQDWQQLTWPEHQDITFLRFLDPQRGYLIGWGPHIWRTEDGGASWAEIPVPKQAHNPKEPRQQLDLVALGKDGVLRFAFLVQGFSGNHSQVYELPWGQNTPALALSLPEQTITDIVDDGHGKRYILSETGLPRHLGGTTNEPRRSQVSLWQKDKVEVLHTFKADLTGYALYLTPSQALLFDGVDESGLRSHDITAISHDAGRSWKIEDEGSSAQGGYYDTATGTRWRVSGYSLYKRSIP